VNGLVRSFVSSNIGQHSIITASRYHEQKIEKASNFTASWTLGVSLLLKRCAGNRLDSIESVVLCGRGADMATSCQSARDVGTVTSIATVGRFTPQVLC